MMSAYCASKAGVESFAQSLRSELEPEGTKWASPTCTGRTATTVTARSGARVDSDATTTLVRVVAFDEAQISSAQNRSNPQPGDPVPTLAAAGRMHIAATLTAGQSSPGSSAPGRRAEDDVNLVAYALRADPGGTGQGHNTNYVVETLRSHPRPGSNSNGAITITHALTSEGADASEDGTGRGTPLVPVSIAVNQDISVGEDIAQQVTGSHGQPGTIADFSGVRRLTPLECERLQGFPDGWTLTSSGRPQADAARYRQVGNAVAVPVVEWIAVRIVAYDARTVVP